VGVLDRFEKGIERAVNGAFAKVFRSEVQPVEIASALRKECDDKAAVIGRERTIAPNAYVVELGRADHQRLGQWADALSHELSAVLADHARQQRYAFVGPVSVSFAEGDDLDTGLFRVHGATTPADPPPHPPDAAPAPLPQPQVAPAPGLDAAGAGAVDPARPVPPAGTARPASIEVDGRPYVLSRSVVVIGRGTEADIVIDDAGASRRHAEVHSVDDRVRIVDLGSTNGTFVDGQKVPVATLHEGSVITIGRTRLVFRAGAGAGHG
jgi:hypothetical protein